MDVRQQCCQHNMAVRCAFSIIDPVAGSGGGAARSTAHLAAAAVSPVLFCQSFTCYGSLQMSLLFDWFSFILVLKYTVRRKISVLRCCCFSV